MTAYVDGGDPRAFDELFRRLAPAIHRFFVRSFRSAAVADDLLQTTFLKLHRARKSYDPGQPLKPWLFTIAARVRLDELRARYGAKEDLDEDALSRAMDAAPPAGETDVADDVRAALDALPESQRVVVHLHRYEGMTFGEIAKALGTTEGAVKLRAFRAYGELRKSLAHLVTK